MNKSRPAGPDDAESIATLEQRSFGARAWSRDQVAYELQRAERVALISHSGGQPTGAALGWSIAGEAELLRISVAPSARRHGLGAHLLDAFKRGCVARDADRVFLEVRADNVAAIGLYIRSGFTSCGRRPHYYPDGSDAVVMEWTP